MEENNIWRNAFFTLLETIQAFGIWILIPIMLAADGILQIVKKVCLFK